MHDLVHDALNTASAGLVDADDLMPRLFADPELGWMDAGLCAQVDPELFFPEKDSGKNTAADAKRVCMGCPVRVTCLDYAVRTGQAHGVWGGLSERERRAVRAARRAGRAGVAA